MKMNFYIPTRMISGKGCVKAEAARLAALGKRCLIVTGASSARKCGALDDVTAALESVGVTYSIYDGIRQNPTLESCLEAGAKASAEQADFILGIGGGSPLDAAKAIAVVAANPGIDQAGIYSLKWAHEPLPVVAVGTTAGTGSEVTPVAVITTPDGRKKSFRTDSMFPVLALGDPTYTLSLPDDFTRSTAADAAAHCLESYFNRGATDASMAFAAQGIRSLLPILRKIAANGTESLTYDDREELYNASIYAGLAISVTGTAFPHAVGYFLSEQHNVAHGTACAGFLPAFLRHNSACVPELTKKFYTAVGSTEEELIALLVAVTPECHVTISDTEQEELAPRWVNNSSINKTWGTVAPEFVREMIAQLA